MASKATRLQHSAEHQLNNPDREPDWRWRLIQFINTQISSSGGPLRASTRDDAHERTAWQVIRGFQRFDNDEENGEFEKLVRKFPFIYYAYDLFSKTPTRPELTLYLQARLLAGQTNEDIAKVMSITPATVEWYEALFFDVRKHLRCRDWIVLKVLNPALNKTPLPWPLRRTPRGTAPRLTARMSSKSRGLMAP